MANTHDLKHDLWKRMSESPFLMIGLSGTGEHSEPLTAQLDPDQVDTLWFFISKDNRLAEGGKAMAQFVSKDHDYFACLAGTAQLDTEPAMVDKLWSNSVDAWFPGGKDDPNLALLRFDISSAELWETDISVTGRLKMLVGGTITPNEGSSHQFVRTTAEGTSEPTDTLSGAADEASKPLDTEYGLEGPSAIGAERDGPTSAPDARGGAYVIP